MLTVALLLLFGLLFLAAEVTFIPGTTVVGLAGFAPLVGGVWLGCRNLDTLAGTCKPMPRCAIPSPTPAAGPR